MYDKEKYIIYKEENESLTKEVQDKVKIYEQN